MDLATNTTEEIIYEQPLLSICVPTYNRPSLLRRTLNSLQSNRRDVEIIVTDNSNDSRSEQVVKETLGYQVSPWRYHKNEPAVTPANNMNAGVRLARGKYIYILHDDDYLLPGGLLKMLEKIEKNLSHPVLKFRVRVVDIHQRPIVHSLRFDLSREEYYLRPELALQNLLSNSSYVRQPSVVLKREVYDKVGFWDDSKTPPNDTDMWMRVFSNFGVYCLPDSVSAYTIHTGSMTTTSFNYQSLNILLGIFEAAKQKGILSTEIYNRCKSSFFHQWLLASTFRYLLLGDYKTARKVMRLFQSPGMSQLSVSVRWLPLKLIFKTILFV